MVGPKHVTRRSCGRGLPSLARLRNEFHRFREEVSCIRSLPSVHRRWPSLARLEIDSEASSEDGAMWDSQELLHGASAPDTADGEIERVEHWGLVNVAEVLSDVCLETSHDFIQATRLCRGQQGERGRAEVTNRRAQFDEGLAKCANEWGFEKIVDQFEEDNHLHDDVQLNPLPSHKHTAESLVGLEQDPDCVDVEHYKERYEFAKPNSPCEDSAKFKDGSESEYGEGVRRGNQEDERNCPLEFLDGIDEGVDGTCTRNSSEDVVKLGLHLAEDAERSLSNSDVGQQKVDNLDETEEIKDPQYKGGGVGFPPSQFDLRHETDGEFHQSIGYCSTREDTIRNVEDFFVSSHDTSSAEPGSLKFFSDDEIVDYSLSHTGARIAATPYFTANPYHKFGQRSSVPHRHIECKNEGSTMVDIQSPIVSASARRIEEEYCNQQLVSNFESHVSSLSKPTWSPIMDGREQTSSVVGSDSLGKLLLQEEGEGTNDLRELKTIDAQGNASTVQSLQSISSEDCKRTLKLVGYVYEEVQPEVAAQMPVHLISRELSSLSTSNPAEISPVELGNRIVSASLMATALDSRSLQPLVTEGIATVDNLMPGSSHTNTASISTAREAGINHKPALRRGGGISSLIALTGIESLTRLGDDSNRDSGLAARMATRIRHALETLGERSHSRDKSWKSSATSLTGHQPRLDMGGVAGYRSPGPTEIVSSNDGRKFRMTTGSDHRKLKIVGDRQRYSEGWDGSDALDPADRSGDSVRPEEPEIYLQQVIAALDTEQDLSAPSEVALKKHDIRPQEHPSSQVHKEEETNLSSLKPCNVAHEHHGVHEKLSQPHKPGCPLHTSLKPCDRTDFQQEISDERHLSSGCLHIPRISCLDRRSVKIDDEALPRGISNSCQRHLSVDETETANPQAFSVKINGSMVEIEVGEQPPSIIWTPRGQIDSEIVRTSPHQTQKQSTCQEAYDELYGATPLSNGKVKPKQALGGPITFTEPTTTQFIQNFNRVVRFRESVLPEKFPNCKSVRFHSPATKNSSKNRIYSPKHIHESFDRTVKSLAQKVQGLGENEASGEAGAENQSSPRLIQRRVQLDGAISPPELRSKRRLPALSPEFHVGFKSLDNEVIDTFSGRNPHGVVPVVNDTQVEETCRSILKSPRGASQLHSELPCEHHHEGSQGTEVTNRIRHSAPPVAHPSSDTQVRRVQRKSILKSPSRQATSSSDCTSSVNHDEDAAAKTDERKAKVEAAATGLANELQVLMRNRNPEISTDQDQHQDNDSMESDAHHCRKILPKHRPKKLPGHFRPKKQAPLYQEYESPGYSKKLPGHSQSTYHSTDTTYENRHTGRFRSADLAGSSYLISEHKKKAFVRLRPSAQPHQQRRTSQNGISVLAAGEGRDRFVYQEAQEQSHNYNMTRAKQIVKETIGDDFDYDRFHKELGELASERKRVEWLGQKLTILQPDASTIRQKKDMKTETLDPHKFSNPRRMIVNKKETGPSGNKRLRSAISPLRESGKKMLRSDSGKKAFSTVPTLQNQFLPCPATSRDNGFDIMSPPNVHSLAGSGNYSFAYEIPGKFQKSEVLSKLQDNSISRRPSHKLVTGFKSCVKKGGQRKSYELPKLEKSRVKFSFMEGRESDRPLGDQFAIKRKNLRPPGSTFKVAMPVVWFPNETTSSKGQERDILMSAPTILETRGSGETALQSLLEAKDGNGTKRGNKMGSKGSPQHTHLGKNTLNEAEDREGHTHLTSDFSSDFCKWVLTPSSVDLHNQKNSILKAELVRVESKASKSKSSHKRTADGTSERQSWSERMKAFLVSCGALLTETNTSKPSKRPPSITRHDKGENLYHLDEIPKMSTMPPERKKNEGQVLPRSAKIANAEDGVVKQGSRTREFARNELNLTPGVERPGNEKGWGSPKNFARQLTVEDCDGGVKSRNEKTKVDKNIIGQKQAHDLLLTMLNTVSTGKAKHNQKVEPKLLQDATKKTTRASGSPGKYSSTLVSLKVKDRAMFPCNNRGKEDSKRAPKKGRMVEVREAQRSALARKSRRQNELNTNSLAKLLEIKRRGANTQHNMTRKCGQMKESPVRKYSDRGIHTVNRDSIENWLNVSGGFEFLDKVCEVKQGLDTPEVPTTVRKNPDIRSSSDVTSLRAWSVRSAEQGVPEAFASLSLIKGSLRKKNNSARQDYISRVSCMGVESGELYQPCQGVLSEDREAVQIRRDVTVQDAIINGNSGIDKGLERNDPSNMCRINLQPQELTGFHTEPADSFENVSQEEYKEKNEVGGPQKPHEFAEGGPSSVVDAQVAEELDFSTLQSQNNNTFCEGGTRSSSDLEDKLTESEELELALLELVLKSVLRDDMVKNAKSKPVVPKEEKSSSAIDQRRSQYIQVDQGVDALVLRVHDVKQSSPTPEASDAVRSSAREWPDYTCPAEKQSRSVSSEEDEDWPEYLGIDEQVAGKVEEEIDQNSSEKISIASVPESTHPVSSMMVPSAASVTILPSSLPTHISANDERESTQFPGLSSLAFASAPPQFKKFASHVPERSSTGVQTNDLTVGQPLNSVYVVPFYCLPDGRPFYPPYSMYPTYPMPEDPLHIHSMQSPPPVRSVQSVGITATPEDVQATSNIHPSKMMELQISNSNIVSRLVLENKNSSSISSDSPLSSPTTPSTPISSPEHEARVASALALAHPRRSHNHQFASFSPLYNNDESELRGDQTGPQTAQKLEVQQIPVSLRDLLAENGQEESSHHLLKTSALENQLCGELVPGSFSSAPTSTRNELEVRPVVSYDDRGSAKLAYSYDGSVSSDLSLHPQMYSGLDVPHVNFKVEGLEKLSDREPNPTVNRVPVNETRAQSPGEIQHTFLARGRDFDRSGVNLGRYPLEAHIKCREREFMRWSGIVRDQGLPFSEGEIEAGGLRSEGECGQMYSNADFRRHNFQYSLEQDGDDVSEPGEISRIVAEQIRRAYSNSAVMGSSLQSLSEGEIKAGMLQRTEPGEMETVSRSAEEKNSQEKEDN